MPEVNNILEFLNATLPAAEPGQRELQHLNFGVERGRLLLVRLETGNEYLPLADAAEGLLAPKAGSVRWQGRPWHALAPQEELDARGRIGRVFEKTGWLSNLNVLENVTLAQRHHTARPEHEIVREADALAVYFGLREVPRQRPAFVSRLDLRMAEWVRALIGKHALLLLERPENGVPDEYLPKLIDVVQTALKRGAAVVWQTDRDLVWNTSIFATEIRCRLQGPEMLLV